MDFICDGVVKPLWHVAAHVFRRRHADNLAPVGLPEWAVLRPACLRQFYGFPETFLVKINLSKTHPVRLNWTARIRIGQRSQVSPRAAPAVAVPPEVRELGLLAANTEDRGFGAEPPPALPP